MNKKNRPKKNSSDSPLIPILFGIFSLVLTAMTVPEVRQFIGLGKSDTLIAKGGKAQGGKATANGGKATAEGGDAEGGNAEGGNAEGGNAEGGDATANNENNSSKSNSPNIPNTLPSPSNSPTNIKKLPSQTDRLKETYCKRIQAGEYKSITDQSSFSTDSEIPIGRQIYKTIAFLGNRGFANHRAPLEEYPKYSLLYGILPNIPAEVACQLPNSGYSSLNLEFGLAQNSSSNRVDWVQADNSTVKLSIYKDGKFFDSRTFKKGSLISWKVDVKNTQNIALVAECYNPGLVTSEATYHNEKGCPNIYFVKNTLE
jgi:hypothetical protein